ncbi:TIGR03915 family putative DNA repair protein [Luteolibacter yonseiensis]|uniref:TIGR03915 family putative DNA repair protein n=1 Tax=Luteolibacter yonseiensis TaxID=1144680 RepID=A0A934R3V7_9BACT|nr:TIGR03915 family putative DNA repair protein [Luteolibacter yonseiensis]MBK1814795.1 TIGR03915 family putative DNA repair protein [Luteolibacter yonseiensis]
MRSVDPGKSFISWRDAARRMLADHVPPEEILWEAERGLFPAVVTNGTPPEKLKVPAAFVDLAQNVSCHNDPSRWALLYQILWRIVRNGEKHLVSIASDPDVSQALLFARAVRKEIHKMHAFVRFRLIDADETGRERYAAWFEPDHHVIEAGAPFFKKRFSNMDWSIFSPKSCAHWDGEHLTFTPGIPHDPTKSHDELEAAWRTYYRSIFNPARLKVKMMKQEMPVRYWKNLPEADLIHELISGSNNRVAGMLAEEPRPVKPRPKNAYLDKLRALSAEEAD